MLVKGCFLFRFVRSFIPLIFGGRVCYVPSTSLEGSSTQPLPSCRLRPVSPHKRYPCRGPGAVGARTSAISEAAVDPALRKRISNSGRANE